MFSRPVIEAIQAEGVKTYTADISVESSPDKDFLVNLDVGTSIPLIAVFAPGRDEPYILQGAYTQQDILRLLDQAREDAGQTASR